MFVSVDKLSADYNYKIQIKKKKCDKNKLDNKIPTWKPMSISSYSQKIASPHLFSN